MAEGGLHIFLRLRGVATKAAVTSAPPNVRSHNPAIPISKHQRYVALSPFRVFFVSIVPLITPPPPLRPFEKEPAASSSGPSVEVLLLSAFARKCSHPWTLWKQCHPRLNFTDITATPHHQNPSLRPAKNTETPFRDHPTQLRLPLTCHEDPPCARVPTLAQTHQQLFQLTVGFTTL